jgi:sporulation protein YlmC with PRC-barrel domain
MLKKHLLLALFGTALISAPSLAQTNPPASSTPARSATTQPMTTGNWITQEQPGQWRTSKLEGLNVYNNNNESIGEIKELLVDNSGKIQAVVLGVGGFLGMGEHHVAVPFEQIKFVNEPRAGVATAPTATGTATTAPPTATTPAPGTAPTTTGTVATDRTAPAPADRAGPDHAMLNMTKDQLKATPEFKFSR